MMRAQRERWPAGRDVAASAIRDVNKRFLSAEVSNLTENVKQIFAEGMQAILTAECEGYITRLRLAERGGYMTGYPHSGV